MLNGSAVNGETLNGSGADLVILRVPTGILVYDRLVLTLPVSIAVQGVSVALSVSTSLVVQEVVSLSVPTSVQVTAQSVVNLSAGVALSVYGVVQLSLPTSLAVVPVRANGVGGQGVGSIVSLPSLHLADAVHTASNVQLWEVRVTLNGIDVSSRLVGQLTVDAEESSAVVATFKLRPTAGQVDPYAWVLAKVTISYVEVDDAGSEVFSYLIFKGLVDTPIYDANTRVTEFTCTDNMQNAVRGMTRPAIDALTPNAKWSRYVFDENTDNWEYLQQRLSTYHYAISMDTNGYLTALDWTSGAITYEFESNTILDGSLAVSLANAREIVNQVPATLNYRHDQFRETVIELNWSEDRWFQNTYMDYYSCSVQMICDAVAQAGAKFVEPPYFNVIPNSRWRNGPNGNTYAFVNDGSELFAVEFQGRVSKRYTQSLETQATINVFASNSMGAMGVRPDAVSATMEPVYNTLLTNTFEHSFTDTRWTCSAGSGMSQGYLVGDYPYNRPLMAVGDASSLGFVSYPMITYDYEIWDSGNHPNTVNLNNPLNGLTVTNSLSRINVDFAAHDHLLPVTQGINSAYQSVYDLSTQGVAGTGHNLPGDHLYDFDSMMVYGNAAERQTALDVLVAEATTKILASHRRNKVEFTTYLNPTLHRTQTLRVSTATVIATGVVNQLVHTLDIDAGTAETKVALALSSAKSVGIADLISDNVVFRIAVEIQVVNGTASVVKGLIPTTLAYYNYNQRLPSHYYTDPNQIIPSWVGHISPLSIQGDNSFVVKFPAIPDSNVKNAATTVQGAPVDVKIPQDELLLFA